MLTKLRWNSLPASRSAAARIVCTRSAVLYASRMPQVWRAGITSTVLFRTTNKKYIETKDHHAATRQQTEHAQRRLSEQHHGDANHRRRSESEDRRHRTRRW